MKNLDYKFWLGLGSFLICAASIVFSAGKTTERLDTLIQSTHNLERQLPSISERVEKQNVRLAIIETRLKIEQKD